MFYWPSSAAYWIWISHHFFAGQFLSNFPLCLLVTCNTTVSFTVSSVSSFLMCSNLVSITWMIVAYRNLRLFHGDFCLHNCCELLETWTLGFAHHPSQHISRVNWFVLNAAVDVVYEIYQVCHCSSLFLLMPNNEMSKCNMESGLLLFTLWLFICCHSQLSLSFSV